MQVRARQLLLFSALVAGGGGLRGAAAFVPLPLLGTGACAICGPCRPPRVGTVAAALGLQMARGRGGERGGGGRGGGGGQRGKAKRGLSVAEGEPAGEVSGAGRGKKVLNRMLRKDAPVGKAGAAVGTKMQDFDPKTMERGTVQFLGSFDADPPQLGLPEVAFVGRSNVGKSSLLNCLTNSKIAVTSKTPGRTQRVNIFAWKESKKAGRVIGMVDLPGFGFAQVARGVKEKISDQLGKYIASRNALKLVVVLVDLRIDPQKTDMDAMELLYSLDIPFIVVGTKAGSSPDLLWAASALACLRRARQILRANRVRRSRAARLDR